MVLPLVLASLRLSHICHCQHVYFCPLFTRYTCLYGRDTWYDAQSFIILHWVTRTSFPLFIVSIKHLCIFAQLNNPRHKSLMLLLEISAFGKIYFPNIKLCHRLVCGRSLILFYRLCLYFIIYFHFLLQSSTAPHGWKKRYKFDPTASGGDRKGRSSQPVLFH